MVLRFVRTVLLLVLCLQMPFAAVAGASSAVHVWPTDFTTSFTASDLSYKIDAAGHYVVSAVLDPGGASGQRRLYRLDVGEWGEDRYGLPLCPYTRTGYIFAGWRIYDTCSIGTGSPSSYTLLGVGYGRIRHDSEGGYVPADDLFMPGERVMLCGDVLEAVWERDDGSSSRLTVQFDANGGRGSMPSATVLINPCSAGPYVLPDCTFTRSGYRFTGWRVVWCCGPSSKLLQPSETIYAHDYYSYSADVLRITLQADWEAEPIWPTNGRTSFSASDLAIRDVLVDGKWTYSIPVVMDPGGASGSPCLYEGFKLDWYPAPACPYSRSGYRFAGWKFYSCCYIGPESWSCKNVGCGGLVGTFQPGESLDVCGVSALVATWEAVPFTVYLDANGGHASQSSLSVTADSSYGYLPTPTRGGYVFAGWYTAASGGTRIYSSSSLWSNSSHTLYAHWTAISSTVSFNANGGSVAQSSKTVTYDGTYGALPEPTRTGHSFNGWYTSASGGTRVTSSTTVAITSSQTLYAHWTIDTYTIQFDANGGGTSPSSVSRTYGQSYGTLPAISRTGYAFGGWYTARSGGTQVTASTTATASRTLFARWTANTYSVAFGANGGTGSMGSQSCTYDVAKTLPSVGFARTGYAFAGWATSAGGNVVYADRASVKNLAAEQGAVVKLYAKWTANAYTVAFDANGGSGTMASVACTYDRTFQLPRATFARSGYDFLGWGLASADEQVAYADGETVRNLTSVKDGTVKLYAVWGGPVVVDGVMTSYIGPTPDVLHVRGDVVAVGDGALRNKALSALVVHSGVRALGTNVFAGCANPVAVYFLGDAPAAVSSAFFAGAPAGTAAYVLSGTKGWASAASTDLPASWPAGPDGRAIFSRGPSEFTVSLLDRGVLAFSVARAFGDAYGDLPPAERRGYAFAGWSRAASGVVRADTLVTNITDHALHAQWTANAYDVVCHQPLCRDTGEERTVRIDCVYDSPSWAPSWAPEGYSLLGWATAPDAACSIPGTKFLNLSDAAGAVVDLHARYGQSLGTLQILLEEANGTENADVDVALVADVYAGMSFPRQVQVNGDAGWLADLRNPYLARTAGKSKTSNVKLVPLTPRWQIPAALTVTNDGPGVARTVVVRRANVVAAVAEAEDGASGTAVAAPAWKCGAATYSAIGQSVDGSTVTLTAKPATGSVLAYWRDDAGNVLGCAPSIKVAPVRDTVYTAVFRAKEASVVDPVLGIDAGESGVLPAEAGAAFSCTPEVALDAWPLKFSAKNLPKGLKIDAATGEISGIPTAPGEYLVAVTAVSAVDAKKSSTTTVAVKVANFTDPLIPVADAYGPYMVGVAMATNLQTVVSGATVSGLPSGLKYDAKTGLVSGVPTKAGSFTVYFKKTVKEANAAGKVSSVVHQASATFRVSDLPAWAQGDFVGLLARDGQTHGSATFTVGKTGKITGKILFEGQTASVSAPAFAPESVVEGATNLAIRCAVKVGKEALDLSLDVAAFASAAGAELASAGMSGTLDGASLALCRNVWKDAAAAPVAAALAGAYSAVAPDGSPVSLGIDEKGAVKVAAVLADGRKLSLSTVALARPDAVSAVLYAPPVPKSGVPEYYQVLDLVSCPGEPGVDRAFRDPGVRTEMAGDGNGFVSLNPKYGQPQAGKPVTATAKPASDSVFVRWEDAEGNVLGYAAALPVDVLASDVSVRAVFRRKSGYTVAPTPYLSDADAFAALRVGVAFRAAVTVDESFRPVTFSAKNLPAGLKLDKNTGAVTGVPTKAGPLALTVTATCTANAKLAGSAVFEVAVAPFDDWALGTFNGGGEDGVVSLAVTMGGKISGKWQSGVQTWSLAATAFDAYDAETATYRATLLGRVGKESLTVSVSLTEAGLVAGPGEGGPSFEAWRNLWKMAPLKDVALKLKGAKAAVDGIEMTVGSAGALTAKLVAEGGYTATCATVLIPMAVAEDGTGRYETFLFYPPKAGKFEGLVRRIVLVWDGAALQTEQ